MATGNPILGTMTGSIGDVTTYRYNGKQAARVRVRRIANPKSAKQAIQRAILATCGRFVSAFIPILNNSIQSETSKVKTLAKIRSYNMDYLRQLAAQNLGFYNRKGSIYVSPNDYIISRGDLQGINPLRSEAARLLLDSAHVAVPTSDLNSIEYSYTASQAFPSVAVGDQITIMATYTADFSRTNTIVRYCRFAFKDDVTPVFLEETDGVYLNPAAIDLTKAEGDWRLLKFSDDTVDGESVSVINFSKFIGIDRVDMAGIIVSREADKKRSSASMVSAIFDDDPDFMIDGVYPTYMDSSSNIEMPSEVYLDNDAQVVNYFAKLPTALPYQLNLPETGQVSIPVQTNFPIDPDSGIQLTFSDGEEGDVQVSVDVNAAAVQVPTYGFQVSFDGTRLIFSNVVQGTYFIKAGSIFNEAGVHIPLS